jgi:parallel beta-helix repeat protein
MRKLVLLGLTIVGNQVHPRSYNGEKKKRLGRKKVSGLILALVLVGMLCAALETKLGLAWSNGGFSADPANPDYGTHDWIAQHALDWLPTGEKEYIVDNLALYLYATELPDNGGAPDGIGDVALHHVYYWANESIQDDASAVRAQTEYDNAVNYMESGDFAMAVKTLGIMSHYVVDVGVFGHVMGVGTDWGPEIHHSDYEDYLNTKTNNYTAEFDTYLMFDGTLDNVSAYDATLTLAFNTTFGDSGNHNCTWMDQNYDWNNAEFKNRCGESLNLAVNYLADVLHTLSRALPVHNINTGLGYATIQEAINAPETIDGHTIFVEAGTYFENIVLNKSISLTGEKRETTIIDGDENGTVVLVLANNTMITGFTIRGSGDKIVDGEHAIRCGIMVGAYETPFKNALIVNNSVKNNYMGVLLWYLFNSQLIDNDIDNNTYGVTLLSVFYNEIVDNNVSNSSLGINAQSALHSSISRNNMTFNNIAGLRMQNSYFNTINENIVENSGYGVDLSESDSNNFTGNTISSNDNGIFFGLSNNNSVYRNNITSNTVYGIYLTNSVSNMIMNNTVSGGSIGVYLYYYSSFNTIRGNIVTGNSEGMYLYYYSNDNAICDNIVSHCDGGFWLEYSNNNTIDNNTVTSNRFAGIYLASYSYNNTIKQNVIADNNRGINQLYSENNTIYHNSFINNTELPETNTYSTNIWDNGYPSGGNYWSDYNGTDLFSGPYQNMTGSDGIGDTPKPIDEDNVDDYPLMSPWIAAPPLAVSVSPESASVHLLQSVTFTSITVGEAPPYSYQWYLNDSPVSGATSDNWTFALEPSGNYTTGTYSVHLNVTDSMGDSATSNQASVTVSSLLGDLNNDSKVDITDVSEVARAFGSSPIRPRWNVQADVNQDGRVDITDVALVAKNFGQHYP